MATVYELIKYLEGARGKPDFEHLWNMGKLKVPDKGDVV